MEIYYFSGTGNTLHVARELKRRIPNIKLIPIISTMDEMKTTPIKSEDNSIGIIFPIYAFTLPPIVEKFLKRIDLSSATYIFAMSTRIS